MIIIVICNKGSCKSWIWRVVANVGLRMVVGVGFAKVDIVFGIQWLVSASVLALRHHHVHVFNSTVVLSTVRRHQLLYGQQALLQPGLVLLSSQVSMQAVFEEGVFWKTVNSADMLRNGHDHLVVEKGVALAVLPDALDPHTQGLAFLQLAGGPQVLTNQLWKMPDIEWMLQKMQSFGLPNIDEFYK